ncbi:MAG: lytic transglycosylase domain-containing protein [Zetaproteobacteria bacterium]|nr:MAG: lytic transglycosylase domain-containing protein [Zetaproteobacteria bacterium]
MNASELRDRLRGISPKALLAGVMMVGFVISLPFWLRSTSEDRQHLTQTSTAMHLVEKSVGFLDLAPEEKDSLKKMLQPEPEPEQVDYEEQVWMEDLVPMIRPWVSNETEARVIARWVYRYSKRFDLDPDLILAVIAVESQFDHFAVSNVGAVGLMQVMPFWKEELGSKEDNLLNIETNIRYGCAILRHYLDRYKNLDRALAAYNGSLGSRKYVLKVHRMMKRFERGPSV